MAHRFTTRVGAIRANRFAATETIFQQTRVYPYPLGAGSARPNPKMGAPDPEKPLFLGFSVLRPGLRPTSGTSSQVWELRFLPSFPLFLGKIAVQQCLGKCVEIPDILLPDRPSENFSSGTRNNSQRAHVCRFLLLKKVETVFGIVFEAAGAKLWTSAGEKLLGSWTGLNFFWGRFQGCLSNFPFHFSFQISFWN